MLCFNSLILVVFNGVYFIVEFTYVKNGKMISKVVVNDLILI